MVEAWPPLAASQECPLFSLHFWRRLVRIETHGRVNQPWESRTTSLASGGSYVGLSKGRRERQALTALCFINP